jgi:hypothetical protein
VLAREALPERLLDVVLDRAVLPLEILVRGLREDADGGAPELGADDLVEVVTADLGVEHVKLRHDGPVRDRDVQVERQALLREHVQLLLRRRVRDVEVVDARALAVRLPEGARRPVPARLEHLVLDAAVARVEVERAMARLDGDARAAGAHRERGEGDERQTCDRECSHDSTHGAGSRRASPLL